jgi:hypothetical protein
MDGATRHGGPSFLRPQFRHAVATGRAESDPTCDLRGALTPWKPEHYPTLTDARGLGR